MNTTKDKTPAVPEPAIGLARTMLGLPAPPPPVNPKARQRGRPMFQEALMLHIHEAGVPASLTHDDGTHGDSAAGELIRDFTLNAGEPLPPIATPRTDAAVMNRWPPAIVPADFARELERENAILRDNLRTLTGLAGGVPVPAVDPRPFQVGDVVRFKGANMPGLRSVRDGLYKVLQLDSGLAHVRSVATDKHRVENVEELERVPGAAS